MVNLLLVLSLQLSCYPACIAKVWPLYKRAGRQEGDSKPPMGVVALFYGYILGLCHKCTVQNLLRWRFTRGTTTTYITSKSSPTLSKIRVCFSNDTVPHHVISAILKISQQCVLCCYYCYFSATGRLNCMLLWM